MEFIAILPRKYTYYVDGIIRRGFIMYSDRFKYKTYDDCTQNVMIDIPFRQFRLKAIDIRLENGTIWGLIPCGVSVGSYSIDLGLCCTTDSITPVINDLLM